MGSGDPVPNDEPVKVTVAVERAGPVKPTRGVIPEIDGAEYEKGSELEVCAETCTDIATPVPWPAGIIHVTCSSVHVCTAQAPDPNVTKPPSVLFPSDRPIMVIVEPPIEGADEGDTLFKVGGLYENWIVFETCPATVMTTGLLMPTPGGRVQMNCDDV